MLNPPRATEMGTRGDLKFSGMLVLPDPQLRAHGDPGRLEIDLMKEKSPRIEYPGGIPSSSHILIKLQKFSLLVEYGL